MSKGEKVSVKVFCRNFLLSGKTLQKRSHFTLYSKHLKEIVDFCTMMAKSIEIVVARFARKF